MAGPRPSSLGYTVIQGEEDSSIIRGKLRNNRGGDSAIEQGEGDSSIMQGKTPQLYRGRLFNNTGGDSSIIQGETPQ